MNKQVDLGASVLIYVVRNFRNKVVALLLRNGVLVPTGSTDVQVAQLVTELLKVSTSFNADFMKLLATPEVLSGFTSMDGYSNFDSAFDSSLGYKSQFATTDFLTKKPASDMANKAIDDNKKKPFDWGKVIEGLQFGVTSYLQADKNQTDRAIADASVKTSGNQVLMTQGGGTGGVTTTGGSNTVLWVVLGVVGVGLIGTVVYFATKK
jgi:hypothetical protein